VLVWALGWKDDGRPGWVERVGRIADVPPYKRNRQHESMSGMVFILFSGSWTLIFLVLGMYALILGVPIGLIVWLRKKLNHRKPSHR